MLSPFLYTFLKHYTLYHTCIILPHSNNPFFHPPTLITLHMNHTFSDSPSTHPIPFLTKNTPHYKILPLHSIIII